MFRSTDAKQEVRESRRHIGPDKMVARDRDGWKKDCQSAHVCVGVSPEGAVLTRGVDWQEIIKGLTGGDATTEDQTSGRLGGASWNIPLGDLEGTIHPAGGVEEHAMVVEGRWYVE